MSSSFNSICRVVAMSCTHCVKIVGHSLTEGMNSDETIQSSAFSLGGHQWGIIYSPNYTDGSNDYYQTTYTPFSNNYSRTVYASFHLKLLSEANHVTVFVSFSVAKENNTGRWPEPQKKGRAFTYTKKGEQNGFSKFIDRQSLDDYVKDGGFIIQCNLHILKPSVEYIIQVPPSDLQQHFGNLLQSKEGADVSFKVKGEVFPAHRSILAARSSVFRAELFDSTKESKDDGIEVEGIEPEVFKALLHFIYTDDAFCDKNDDQATTDEETMAKHLIAASDRYDLYRLRLICEEKLAGRICSDNVLTTLLVAAQHNCRNLETICLDYMSSAKNLQNLIESDAFKSLIVSRPSILEDLMKKIAAKMNMTELTVS